MPKARGSARRDARLDTSEAEPLSTNLAQRDLREPVASRTLSAISAFRRGSKSAKVNSMQDSSPTSMGWPAIRIACMIIDYEAADAVNPITVLVRLVGHHNHGVFERLSGNHAIDRESAMVEQLHTLMTKDEVVPIFVDRSAELVEGRDAVHLQSSLVSIDDPLVGFDQDHALAQAIDDLLQLEAIGSFVLGGLVPGHPSRWCDFPEATRLLAPDIEIRTAWVCFCHHFTRICSRLVRHLPETGVLCDEVALAVR